MKIKTLAIALLAVASVATAMPAGSRITLPSGKKIFVSGMNLAWITYAGDVGNTPLSTSSVGLIDEAMKAVHDSGGNAMRIWLSTDGTKDPIYGGNGLVSGPGSSTIANIQKMLQLAKKNNILLMPVLMTHNWVNKSINASILANNKTMLTTEDGLKAYLDNYLTPVVKAIGDDPNLLCWEVFNEPEGMVDGWSSPAGTITKAQVQRAVNRVAGTIHRLVPGVLVSNGAAYMGAMSWYSDAALKAAGGDADGTLDFYMAHYYGWNGTSNSPFTKSYAAWSFDKPLVIGEYASSDWSTSTNSSSRMQDAGKVDTLMNYLNKAGYAGGLGWQYQQDQGDPWLKGFPTFGHSIRVAYLADSNSIKLDGTGDGKFSVSVGAGMGGSVVATPAGRVDSGKSVTLVATPAAGYTFAGWTGDTTASTATLVIASVVKDRMITASFKPDAGTNLLKNGDFASDASWSFYAAKNNTASATFTSKSAVILISAQDDTNHHIQLSQSGVQIDSGVVYMLSFDASATTARTLNLGLSSGAPGWKWLGGGEAEIGTTTKPYSVEIKSLGAGPSADLQFNLGGATGTVTIDNVSLVRAGGTRVSRVATSAGFRLQAVPGGFSWTRPGAATGATTIRLLDASGRELHRSTSAAASGFVPSAGIGLRFAILENGSLREVRSLAGMR